MILEKRSSQVTHYEILDVKEDATYEQIRVSYRSALLSSHPDKLLSSSDELDSSGDRFSMVQKAWEILGDSKSRAMYDRELQASRDDDAVIVADDISLKDMEVEGEGDALELCYQCRCGDYFSVSHLELEDMGYRLSLDGSEVSIEAIHDTVLGFVILPCGSCSLRVRLSIHVKLQNSVRL